jgi:hypothetical protein
MSARRRRTWNRRVDRAGLSALWILALAPGASVAAQRIPQFDVAASCRATAQRAMPVGNVDACLETERRAREQLAREWPSFAPADKSHCVELAHLGGEPTYTELVTCLEIARDARTAGRDRDGTNGQAPR